MTRTRRSMRRCLDLRQPRAIGGRFTTPPPCPSITQRRVAHVRQGNAPARLPVFTLSHAGASNEFQKSNRPRSVTPRLPGGCETLRPNGHSWRIVMPRTGWGIAPRGVPVVARRCQYEACVTVCAVTATSEESDLDRSLDMLRHQLELLLAKEDDLLRLHARKLHQPEPPMIQLNPELLRREVVLPSRGGRTLLQTGSSPDWIHAEILRVRKRRDDAERRFLAAARRADERSTGGAPLTTTSRPTMSRERTGIPAWVVGVIVVLFVLVNAGSSDSGSKLLPILGLIVAVIGLVPTAMSAYFDFRAHQRRNQARSGTDSEES